MAGCGFSNGFDNGFERTCLADRPVVVSVEGVRPFELVIDADPILIVRAYAGPIRELLDADERYQKRLRE